MTYYQGINPNKIIDVTEDCKKLGVISTPNGLPANIKRCNDFLEDLHDRQGYEYFLYENKLYTLGWDDYFFFIECEKSIQELELN